MSCGFFQNGRIQCKRRTCKKKRLCKEGSTPQNKCCSCVRKSIVHFSILKILNFVFESKMELLMFRKKERKGNCSTLSVSMGCIYHVYDIHILFFNFLAGQYRHKNQTRNKYPYQCKLCDITDMLGTKSEHKCS